ncbi:CinA domain protein [Methylocella silvestris BL2]|uniref:CinA domain protein n=1 Tax=Methylocella silvestris (strain DSM 15510 / CIP 108128 / LMG 27833 / NCIMB 13906 / BL2) TaxID=395965 RepID=B8EJU3_METSB|nr:CinA family protein [Methylocella silvestris]ACK49497.1 CinA domain protein [Methylocella silvestris BL2]
MFGDPLLARAAGLVALYRESSLTFASAESCTGGLIAALVTAIPGSSDVFERGFVTYSNSAKAESLGVEAALIERVGAVSADVAAAMAAGILTHSPADVALSVTGIAGPGGGSPAKPVGLVFFGCARRGAEPKVLEQRFGDLGRNEVRMASVLVGLDLLEAAAR